MAGRLQGKVTIVTGSARGTGAEIARLFAAEGARVLVSDVLDAQVARRSPRPSTPSAERRLAGGSATAIWRCAARPTGRRPTSGRSSA